MKKVILAISLAFLASTLVTGCGSSAKQGPHLQIVDPVVRSIDDASYKDEAGKYMTGSFMTIQNHGDKEVTLVGGTSESAERIEIHEVIAGKMTPMAGGLKIPAGKEVKLRMGGYHVMLLGLTNAIKAGDEVTVTLEFDDGTSVDYTAPVKDIAMDDEKYGAMSAGKEMAK